jgi:glycosyltransferase involved in cell wall biosynthesis
MHERDLAMLSTYPPRSCGIATFCSDTVKSLADTNLRCRVFAIDEETTVREYPPEVAWVLKANDRAAHAAAGRTLQASSAEAVIVQHEFGIFGGPDGEWLLDLYAEIQKPIFTTLHTVPIRPSPNQRRILERLSAESQGLIVLSEIARGLLADIYNITENVSMVPHGVPDIQFANSSQGKKNFTLDVGNRPIVSTFGLIGRGKGLEYGIKALVDVKRNIPDVLYIIAGRTHPAVIQSEGEAYRTELMALIREYHLDDNVIFINEFLSLSDLIRLLAATDVYFTPYINPDQVVSGTLAYAMGAGKAIISTPYLYAQELLGEQRGLLCNFSDSADMAEKLVLLLSDDTLRLAIEQRSYSFGHAMIWSRIAQQLVSIYTTSATSLTVSNV